MYGSNDTCADERYLVLEYIDAPTLEAHLSACGGMNMDAPVMLKQIVFSFLLVLTHTS